MVMQKPAVRRVPKGLNGFTNKQVSETRLNFEIVTESETLILYSIRRDATHNSTDSYNNLFCP